MPLIYFAEFNEKKNNHFQNVASVRFLEDCFIQCVLGKDEKYSRISENFLDIWAA